MAMERIRQRNQREVAETSRPTCRHAAPRTQAIAAIQAMLDARAGDAAQVIEGEAEVVPSLPAPVAPKPAL